MLPPCGQDGEIQQRHRFSGNALKPDLSSLLDFGLNASPKKATPNNLHLVFQQVPFSVEQTEKLNENGIERRFIINKSSQQRRGARTRVWGLVRACLGVYYGLVLSFGAVVQHFLFPSTDGAIE